MENVANYEIILNEKGEVVKIIANMSSTLKGVGGLSQGDKEEKSEQ